MPTTSLGRSLSDMVNFVRHGIKRGRVKRWRSQPYVI
jgi:hypothetical protein